MEYGDLFDPLCPTRTVIDAIGDKWSTIVIVVLSRNGPTRFNELARTAKGISYKMLTQTLRRLERDGFITRTVEATRPPSVTYGLTPLAKDLVPLLEQIRSWAEVHVGEIVQSRQAHSTSAA